MGLCCLNGRIYILLKHLLCFFKKNNETAWTITLNEDFERYSDALESNTGNINLYKATLGNNQPIILHLSTAN